MSFSPPISISDSFASYIICRFWLFLVDRKAEVLFNPLTSGLSVLAVLSLTREVAELRLEIWEINVERSF